MLWLAGLMGIMGVGAASIVPVQPVEEQDDDLTDNDTTDLETGNLLDTIASPKDMPLPHPGNPDAVAQFKSQAAGAQATFADDLFRAINADQQREEDTENLFLHVEEEDKEAAAALPEVNIFDKALADERTSENAGADALTDGGDSASGLSENGLERGLINPLDRAFFEGYPTDTPSQDIAAADPASDDETPFASDESYERILLSDWIMEGQTAEVLDYDAREDSLLLVWDDMSNATAEPEVDVAHDPYDEEVMHVVMNGKSVAEIYGDPNLSVADVALIPLSAALLIGLEPA
ncbi:hypothetical protein [Roseobacter weihaiensis]|uniref:hypothetical protein n=1 Tax=Roseobacter weihaiensis TaxID=2763262 RepID=UPI001D0B5FED|nr:hypothetical protein [Roseobacter sp. H9]